MGKAISRQHPAVVLRSHYTLARALLAIALLALVGLTVAVVILANDGDEISTTSSARPTETIHDGGFNPATGRPESAPLPQQEHPLRSRIAGTRYDGGPDEGTRGPLKDYSRNAPGNHASAYELQLRRYGFTPRQAAREARPGTRYDGGPDH